MRVFKGYMLIVKKNLGIVIEYLAIFILITMIINSMIGDTQSESYASASMKVAVIDQDQSAFSKQFIQYLEKKQDVTVMEDDKAKIQEKMFYGEIEYVITIPEDFEEKCLENEEKLKVTKEPGKYSAVYLDQEIVQFMGQVKTYKSAGYQTDEAAKLVIAKASEAAEVELIDKNGNGGIRPGYIWMTQFLPYFYAAVFSYCIGAVIVHFRQPEVKRRIQCAPQSLVRRNAETILAYLIVGAGVWAVSMIMPIAYYKGEFLSAPHLGYILLNTVTMSAAALAVGLVVGMAARTINSINMFSNLSSLVLCFLGGVFVDLSVMGAGVKKVSVFLPTYWYVKNNNLFGDYLSFTKQQMVEIQKGYGIQLAFAAACIGIALVISRMKEQEEN